MLENLEPAPKVEIPRDIKPGIEINGNEGTATTPGLPDGADFRQFIIDAGYNPEEIEIVGNPRTSRWQKYDGDWLTSYRFNFRLIKPGEDLRLLFSRAKTKFDTKPKDNPQKCLVVGWSDTQTGKVGSRGNTTDLVSRINEKLARLDDVLKKEKPDVTLFLNVGDSIEGFENTGGQLFTNDLSIMEQVDLEATMQFEALKLLAKRSGNVIAASVGSNHCQWRRGKDRLGNPLDDWGIHIQRQLARLAQETNAPIKFYEPQPFDESLAIPMFDEVIGLVHGHQANKPEGIPQWWRNQSHGDQAVADATILVSGHFHHLRVMETGRRNGRSRWWIQCPTLDNGSDWYRQRYGDDSDPGLLVFTIEKGKPFGGTVAKL